MKIEIPRIKLPNGVEIVAEKYDYDGNHPEITVCLWKDGVIWQDLCMIRPYESNKENIEILVWDDKDDDDYTNRFIIGQYKEE